MSRENCVTHTGPPWCRYEAEASPACRSTALAKAMPKYGVACMKCDSAVAPSGDRAEFCIGIPGKPTRVRHAGHAATELARGGAVAMHVESFPTSGTDTPQARLTRHQRAVFFA